MGALNITRGLNIRWCERELSKEIKKVDEGEWETDVLQPNNSKENFLEQAEKVYNMAGKRLL